MEVTVKTLDSQTKTFNVLSETTVRDFKKQVAEEMGIPVEKQRLIFQGKVLQDEKQLQEYKVNGCVIHLVEKQPPRNNRPNGQSTETTTSSTSSTTSTANMVMGAFAFPVDVMGVTQQIVQGIIQQIGAESAQANISTTSSQDGSSVNVHINLSTIMSRNNARSRIRPAQVHLDNVANILNRLQNDGMLPNNDMNEETSNSNNAENETQSGNEADSTPEELADVLQRVLELNDEMRPHIQRYQELLRSSERQLRPGDDLLPDLTAEALHSLSHAYHALSDLTTNFRVPETRLNVLPSTSPVQAPGAAPHLRTGATHIRRSSVGNGANQPGTTMSNGAARSTVIAGNRMFNGSSMLSGAGGLPTGTAPTSATGTRPFLGVPINIRNLPNLAVQFNPTAGNITIAHIVTTAVEENSARATTTTTNSTPMPRTSTRGSSPAPTSQGNSDTTNSQQSQPTLGQTVSGHTTFSAVPTSGTAPTSLTPGAPPFTNPGAPLFTNPGAPLFTHPGDPPSINPGARPSTNPGATPTPSGATPSATSGATPSAPPGATPSAIPGDTPSAPPGATPSPTPGVIPSAPPGATPSPTPGATPGGTPSATPGDTPSAIPGAPPSSTNPGGRSNTVLYFAPPNAGHRDPLLPCQSFHFSSLTQRPPGQQRTNGRSDATQARTTSTGSTSTTNQRQQPEQQRRTQQTRLPPDGATEQRQSGPTLRMPGPDLIQHLLNLESAGGNSGFPDNPFLDLFLSPPVGNTNPPSYPGDIMNGTRTATSDTATSDGMSGTLSRFMCRMAATYPLPQLMTAVMSSGTTGRPCVLMRSMIRDFLRDDILCGEEATPRNLQRATESLLEEFHSLFETTFAPLKVKDGIDAPATLTTYLRPKIRRILEVMNSSSSDEVYNTEMMAVLSRMPADMTALTEYCLQDGVIGLEAFFRSSVASSAAISRLEPEQRGIASNWMWTCILDLRDSNNVRESSLLPFVVRKEKRKQEAKETSPKAARKNKEEEKPSRNHESSGSASTTNAKAEEASMETDEDWKKVIPPEWVPVISQDIMRQRRLPRQRPFSDAYISGMPPKRRKLTRTVEPAPYGECLSATLRRSIAKSGVTPKTDVERISREASSSPVLGRVFEQEVKNEVRDRLSKDKDYKSEKFPSIHNYFEKDR